MLNRSGDKRSPSNFRDVFRTPEAHRSHQSSCSFPNQSLTFTQALPLRLGVFAGNSSAFRPRHWWSRTEFPAKAQRRKADLAGLVHGLASNQDCSEGETQNQ